MPRKTIIRSHYGRAEEHRASMRPRPDATENVLLGRGAFRLPPLQ